MRCILLYIVLFLLVSIKPANAQLTACDSVEIINVEYWPFGDSLIAVYVQNNSSNIFSYPGFILFNANGDTIAKETVNYFGIGSFEQVHMLQVKQGVQVQESFNGYLELWSGFYSNLECTFNKQIELCPDSSCAKLYLSASNLGGAITMSVFTWEIKNLNGTVLYSGTLDLNGSQQMDLDSLCLPFGSYTVEYNTSQQPMGQVFTSMYTSQYASSGPGGQFILNNSIYNFDFFEACDGSSSIEIPSNYIDIKAYVNDDILYISNLSGKAIGDIFIYDTVGRLIIQDESKNESIQINLNNYPASSYYLLNIQKEDGSFSKKFFNK